MTTVPISETHCHSRDAGGGAGALKQVLAE
jgi:hypothetical protein